jgi:hypothetical protein
MFLSMICKINQSYLLHHTPFLQMRRNSDVLTDMTLTGYAGKAYKIIYCSANHGPPLLF